MIIGALLSIAIMIIIMFAPTLSLVAEMCSYFILGFIISVQVIGYPIIAESNPHALIATATSLASFLITSSNILVPLFGWLLDRSHDIQVTDAVVIYSQADFIRADYLMLIGTVIAFIISFLIKETYGKQFKQN
ncbi:MAG: hypothetical protein LBL17_01190 [Coxiellaceae bacterium]|jgi:hypothetical protein|nr:hypothetical protein [Coxiellaceae bacterium]